MSRRLPLQQLLRALSRAGPGGGTMPIPVAWVAADAGGPLGGCRTASQHQQHQQHQWLLSRGFASRGPSFLDPQGRRAVKQKRQAKQRQRLLREMKGGSSVVAVGGAGDAAAAAAAAAATTTAPPPRRAAGAAPATAGDAQGAAAPAASPAGSGGAGAPAGSAPAAPGPRAAASPAANPAAPLDDDDDDAAAGGGGPVPLEMQRERSSWLPGWMRGILPERMGGGGGFGGGGRARRRRQQQQEQQEPGAAAADGGADAAAAAAAAAEDGDDDGRYANLEKYRDLGLEAFLQHQAEQSDDAPPPPKPAPPRGVPPLSPLRHAHQAAESRRVLHYRARHHVRIVEALREPERALVEADPRASASRPRLLRSVSARTGYSPGQVADCLRAYEALRFRVNALCDWRAAGRRMPRTQSELSGVVERARRARETQDLAVLLAERRTPGPACPLRPGHLSALGGRRRAVCPQTGLPFRECCGALEGGEAGLGGGGGGGRQRARAAAAAAR